mgnify:CR=1 FL=1
MQLGGGEPREHMLVNQVAFVELKVSLEGASVETYFPQLVLAVINPISRRVYDGALCFVQVEPSRFEPIQRRVLVLVCRHLQCGDVGGDFRAALPGTHCRKHVYRPVVGHDDGQSPRLARADVANC